MEHEHTEFRNAQQTDTEPGSIGTQSASLDDERARFVAAVQAGLDDCAAGRVVSHEEVGRILDELFGPLSESDGE